VADEAKMDDKTREPISETAEGGERQTRRRGIYLLPNLFTTAALFAGFFAVVSAIQGRYPAATMAIFLAMVMDGLDGRVARLTNTTSDFCKEFDSLSDAIVFGMATALVIYTWSLQYLGEYGWFGGKLGWLAAFLYAACTALRLARFNNLPLTKKSTYFYGLPCPSAAGLTMGFVWTGTDMGLSGAELVIPSLVLTLIAAGLMVSNVRYYSFKEFKGAERVPFTYVIVMVVIFALIALNPPRVLFIGFAIYVASGPALAFRRYLRKRRYRA